MYMTDDTRALIQYRLNRAKESLADAELLNEHLSAGAAANR